MNRPPITVNPNRIELDEAYLQMAEVWGKRSKANRLQVGALVVVGKQIVSDGYNGMPSGWHDDVCEVYAPDGSLLTKPEVLHAESNALLKIVRYGGRAAEGGTLYTTWSPCPECAKLANQAGIKRVVFRHLYRRPEGLEMLQKLGIQVQQLGQTAQAAPQPVQVPQATSGVRPTVVEPPKPPVVTAAPTIPVQSEAEVQELLRQHQALLERQAVPVPSAPTAPATSSIGGQVPVPREAPYVSSFL